jgi:hypothetical protein
MQQVTEQLQRPVRFVSADEPTLRDIYLSALLLT